MTDSLIDVGHSSKKSATKVAAAFPNKKISKKKSPKRLYSTKVEAVLSSKIKKEEAADFKEAMDEKMKEPQVKKKAEESVTAAAENGSSDSVAAGKFRAYVAGFGTGAKDIHKELRQHFENCGGIEGISVNDQAGYAQIDFTSLESLLKALQQDKTSFCGHPLTRPLYIYRGNTNKSTFRACISRLDTGSRELDVLRHFKICGEIEDICVRTPGFAEIEFASLASLDKALEFNNTIVGDHPVSVLPNISCLRRFRVEIRGFDTGAGAEALQLDKTSFCGRPLTIYILHTNKSTFTASISGLDTRAQELDVLRHFKICGEIENIYVRTPRCAHIDFASLDGLEKALELNRTMVGGHRVNVVKLNSCMRRFRAEIRGFDTGAGAEALRKHFKECGSIVGISVSVKAGYACIEFANRDSIFKALKLNKTKVGDHLVTVRQPAGDCFITSEFRAGIRWQPAGDIDLNALRSHFEKCGEIAGILLTGREFSRSSAEIDFTNLDSLNNALKLHKSSIGNHVISVQEQMLEFQSCM